MSSASPEVVTVFPEGTGTLSLQGGEHAPAEAMIRDNLGRISIEAPQSPQGQSISAEATLASGRSIKFTFTLPGE